MQFLLLWWPLAITLFHYYFITNFPVVMNYNISIWYAGYLIYYPQRGFSPQVKNCCIKYYLLCWEYLKISLLATFLRQVFFYWTILLALSSRIHCLIGGGCLIVYNGDFQFLYRFSNCFYIGLLFLIWNIIV